MTYQIGQIVSHHVGAGGILGADLSVARWHVLRVISGLERRVANVLRDHGTHCCYPVEEHMRRDRQGKSITVDRPAVPGYVLAKFRRQPVWSEMRRQHIIIGMACRDTPWGPVPYEATENDVRAFMDIPTIEEELEAQRREALRVKPGDKARVLIGSDVGMAVRVTSVTAGRVFWEVEGTAFRGATDERMVVRDEGGTGC